MNDWNYTAVILNKDIQRYIDEYCIQNPSLNSGEEYSKKIQLEDFISRGIKRFSSILLLFNDNIKLDIDNYGLLEMDKIWALRYHENDFFKNNHKILSKLTTEIQTKSTIYYNENHNDLLVALIRYIEKHLKLINGFKVIESKLEAFHEIFQVINNIFNIVHPKHSSFYKKFDSLSGQFTDNKREKNLNIAIEKADETIISLQEYLNDFIIDDQKNKTFNRGEGFDSLKIISDQLNKTKKRIKITDPYINMNTLTMITDVLNNKQIEVQIITSAYGDINQTLIKKLKDQYKIDFKIKSQDLKDKVLHDRYICIDDKTLIQMGCSLKDFGRTENTISFITEAPEIKKWNSSFSEKWKNYMNIPTTSVQQIPIKKISFFKNMMNKFLNN